MKISVVIPNYNYAAFLEDTVASVFSQTYKNLECVVVNDGSTDNSYILLENLKKNKFPDLIIVNKENGGLSSARNAGIKKATGDLIAFLDADDFWSKDKLEHQVDTLIATAADIVFSNYQTFDGSQFTDHHETIVASPDRIDFISQNPVVGSSSSVLIKKSVIDKVGFFDPNLRSLEDLDYWFRCSVQGFSFVFCNFPDVFLRRHPTSMETNHSRMLFYHLIVLDNQMNFMTDVKHDSSQKKRLIAAISNRLNLINWYAVQSGKHEYSFLTIVLGMRLVGARYLFSKIVFLRLIKNVINVF